MKNYSFLTAAARSFVRIGSVCAAIVMAGLTASGGSGFAQQQAPKAAPAAEIDPKAIDALKAMGAELRKLKTFALRSETTKDEVLDNGQKVQFGGTVDYRVRLPNGVRAEIDSDRKKRQYFYNGKTLTQYGPLNGYYASVAAPPTIPELIQFLDEKYGLEWPLADLFLDVDVDVDRRDYHPVARAAATTAAVTTAAVVTSAVVGSMVHTLPPACSAVIVNGLTYKQCGGAWYQPQYAGTSVTYVVVNPPR